LGGKIMARLKEYKLYRFYAFVQLRFLGSITTEHRQINASNQPKIN
jgi:hypothetical protein